MDPKGCAHFKPVAMQSGSRHIHVVYYITHQENSFRILRSAALNSGPLINSDSYLKISYVTVMQFAYCWDLVFQNCYAGLISYLVGYFEYLLRSLYRIIRQPQHCFKSTHANQQCFGCFSIMPMHIDIVLSAFVFIHCYRTINFLVGSVTPPYNFIQCELIIPIGYNLVKKSHLEMK